MSSSATSPESQPLLSTNEPDSPSPSSTPTTSTPKPSTRNTLTLPSGETLSYAIYGNPSPTAPTILYLHGYPSSRLEASLLHRLALRHDPPLRIIAPDRPGFGFSSPIRGRGVGSYAREHVVPLLECEELWEGRKGKVSVMGLSGGGPYALGCTFEPRVRERSGAVGVVVGAPYWSEMDEKGKGGWKMLPWWSKVGYYLAWYVPGPTRVGFEGLVAGVRWLCGTGWARGKLEGVLVRERERREGGVGEWEASGRTGGTAEDGVKREVDRVARIAMGEDQSDWSAAEQREDLVQQLLEPFRQGARASVEELKLYTLDWGFRLADVDWDEVVMWHGTKDVNAPIQGARYMARQVKGAELREYEGTHGEVICRFEEILVELAKPLIADEERGGDQ